VALICRKIDHLLPEYLDGVLNDRDRRKVDKHLAVCAACRADLAMQREWLQLRAENGLHRQTAVLPAGLNDRIMSMIRAEEPPLILDRPTLARRLTRWPSLAGMAAAVLILIAAWQVIPQLMLTGRATLPENYTMTGSGQASMTQQQRPEGADNSTDPANLPWQVVTQFSGEKTATTGNTSEIRDCFGQMQAEIPDAIIDILADARDIRYASQGSPASRALILVSFAPETMKNKFDLLKNALSTCENPVQIEIINEDALAVTLTELDYYLFSQFFPDGVPASSWILILIGA